MCGNIQIRVIPKIEPFTKSLLKDVKSILQLLFSLNTWCDRRKWSVFQFDIALLNYSRMFGKIIRIGAFESG